MTEPNLIAKWSSWAPELRSVLRIADRVALWPNVRAKFPSVTFSTVSGWAHARAKAAFARIP